MAQGYNKSVSGTKAVAPTMDLNGLFKTNYTGSVNESTKYLPKEQTIDINIEEYMDIEIKPEEPKKAWYEQALNLTGDFLSAVGDVLLSAGATVAVGTTSILSGIADIGEAIVDGGAWLVAGGADLLGFDDAAKNVRGFIATDWVSEANKVIYEDTLVGQILNDASVLKYDSDVAQGIREVTTTVTEMAAATALTVVTGGAAAPLVAGAVVGLGKASESAYQTNGTDTNLLQEGGILLSGGLNGLSWVANGKLGAGAIEIGKDVASLGAKNVLSNMSKDVLNKEFVVNSLKKGLASKQAIGNYVGATLMTADSAIPYITGEKEFDATAAMMIAGRWTTSLALNVVEDSLRDYVSLYHSNVSYTAQRDPHAKATRPQYFNDIDQSVEWEKWKYDSQVKQLSQKFGVSEDEIRAILDEKVVSIVDSSDFGKRTKVSTLEKMLDNDEGMKNLFETGTSGGLNNQMERINTEGQMFKISTRVGEVAPADRPIYGMCIPSLDQSSNAEVASYIQRGPGAWYGGGDGCFLVFDKDAVIDAATLSLGDSLDYRHAISAMTATNPSYTGGFTYNPSNGCNEFLSDIHTLDELQQAGLTDLFTGTDQYLEVQLHGQETHGLDIIKEVVFTKTRPSQTLLNKLTEKGISYRILN